MHPIPPAVRAEHLLQDLQNDILEAIAFGDPLPRIADWICRYAEAISHSIVCSILRVDGERRLRLLAAPSLPESWAGAIDGAAIGPDAGPCGRAADSGEPVEVRDLAADPLRVPRAMLAGAHGLEACWSSPIKVRDGRVVGILAFHYRECRGPSPLERRLVETSLHLCAIAIEQAEVQARNLRLAYYDTLTGLPNRSFFNQEIGRCIAPGEPRFGLLLIDIDHLKAVNDTMGHAVGDTLIATIARRIDGLGLAGTAFRIGGDELAILLMGCDRAGPLRQAAHRILAAMSAPFEDGGHTVQPSVTIGGALSGEHGSDAATLRQNADFALYHAKETRRGGYIRFRQDLRTTITRRIQTIRMVDTALAENRVTVHFQPVVRIDTAEIVGLEALARLRLPDGEIMAAGAFVQAMSDPRVAYRLTGQVLGEVAANMRRWLDEGVAPQHVGINVTTADFLRGDLTQRIMRAFGRYEVPLRHIILEVTETVLMGGRDDLVTRTIASLRDKGVLVALDDFGTGHASLTHLLQVPVDIIKIDRSFVARLPGDSPGSVIVEALTTIAGRLKMRVVAEGVEDEAQAQALLALGCRLAQGYLYARPASGQITTGLLRHFRQRGGGRPVASGQVRPGSVAAA